MGEREDMISTRARCLQLANELAAKGVNHSVGTAAQYRPPLLLEQTSDIVATAAEFFAFVWDGKIATSELQADLQSMTDQCDGWRQRANRLAEEVEKLRKRKPRKKARRRRG